MASLCLARHCGKRIVLGTWLAASHCAIVLAAPVASADPVSAAPEREQRPAALKPADQGRALNDLSMEELMQVSVMDTPVTSVTKQKARIADAPAAITVLSQDQIRRSGHTSIPELLRMVPGLNVARVNASQWAISARGFNDPYSNKLLVLQDGRTLYNPLFAGV